MRKSCLCNRSIAREEKRISRRDNFRLTEREVDVSRAVLMSLSQHHNSLLPSQKRQRELYDETVIVVNSRVDARYAKREFGYGYSICYSASLVLYWCYEQYSSFKVE